MEGRAQAGRATGFKQRLERITRFARTCRGVASSRKRPLAGFRGRAHAWFEALGDGTFVAVVLFLACLLRRSSIANRASHRRRHNAKRECENCE
jgi:hypothetical protein